MWVSGYDINCQYRINWKTRLANIKHKFSSLTCMAKNLDVHPATLIAIGKFHLPAHKESCRFKFSYNFLPGVGLTDGEASERQWAWLNGISTRAKEMTWGHRHDTLNNFWNDMNVRRQHSMGMCSTR